MKHIVLVILLFASLAQGAITRVALGTGINDKNGSGIVINVSGIQAGSVIVVLAAADAGLGTVQYFYDGVNSVVHDAFAVSNNSGNVAALMRIFHNVSASSGSAFLSIGALSGEALAVVAIELRGVATSSSVDKEASGTGTSTDPTTADTDTTTCADEILIAALGTEGPNGDTAGTFGLSFTGGQRIGTTGGGAASNVTVSEGYRIVSSTGTYRACKGNLSPCDGTDITSRDYAFALASFKDASCGGAPSTVVQDPIMRGVIPFAR